MVLFALSCFGLLLFLWVSFGGTTPLATKGYRFDVVLPAANNIAQQADVRISGVPVGKVVAIGRTGHYAKVTQQIEPRYVPLPSDIRVALRRKTLLGETYIELTPGSKRAPPLKEGATLPVNHAQQDVPLDQILNTFDPKTRQDLRTWLAGWAVGVKGRAPEISDDFSHFTGVLDSGNNLLGVLDQQRQALSTLIRDTGTTFGTIGDTNSRVSQLITAGDSVFRSTASQAANLTATFEALPGFLRSLRGTLAATQRIARPLTPARTALKPSAGLLKPTLDGALAISPRLRTVARQLGPVTKAAPAGLDAARSPGGISNLVTDNLESFDCRNTSSALTVPPVLPLEPAASRRSRTRSRA
jgi:phospholipid/cholesterol/gamma-HCH transport system substrate-binding protein